MNLTELKTFIASLDEDKRDEFREHIEGAEYNKDPKRAHLKIGDHDIVIVDCISSWDGGEGGRGHQAVFTVDDALFAHWGYYESNEGTTWNDLSEIYSVTKKEKTIIVYE
jgi:hypothetical protein